MIVNNSSNDDDDRERIKLSYTHLPLPKAEIKFTFYGGHALSHAVCVLYKYKLWLSFSLFFFHTRNVYKSRPCENINLPAHEILRLHRSLLLIVEGCGTFITSPFTQPTRSSSCFFIYVSIHFSRNFIRFSWSNQMVLFFKIFFIQSKVYNVLSKTLVELVLTF